MTDHTMATTRSNKFQEVFVQEAKQNLSTGNQTIKFDILMGKHHNLIDGYISYLSYLRRVCISFLNESSTCGCVDLLSLVSRVKVVPARRHEDSLEHDNGPALFQLLPRSQKVPEQARSSLGSLLFENAGLPKNSASHG
jgi:hypothetical protein